MSLLKENRSYLTPEETVEQENFVKNTLKVIVVRFVTIEGIKIVDEEGNDVTPELRNMQLGLHGP